MLGALKLLEWGRGQSASYTHPTNALEEGAVLGGTELFNENADSGKTYQQTILATPDLLAYWPLDEASGNPQDRSGNGYHATTIVESKLTRRSTPVRPFRTPAMTFDQSGGTGIQMAGALSTAGKPYALTVEGWWYIPAQVQPLNTNWSSLITRSWGSSNAVTWLFYMSNFGTSSNIGKVRRMQFGVWPRDVNGIGSQINAYWDIPAEDRWYYCAGTFDGTNVRTYIDGVLRSSLPHRGLPLSTQHAINIGNNTSGEFTPISDVAMYNRVLSAAEIAEHYRIGLVSPYRHAGNNGGNPNDAAATGTSTDVTTVGTVSEAAYSGTITDAEAGGLVSEASSGGI